MVDLGKAKNLPQKRAIAEKRRSVTNMADLQELVGMLMEQNTALAEQNEMLIAQIADMQEAVSSLNENV